MCTCALWLWVLPMSMSILLLPVAATGQEARLEVLPIRPFYVELALRQTFPPNGREVGVQAGVTAFRYGDLELNGAYQHFGVLCREHKSELHSVYVNPRSDNCLDILHSPSRAPITR